jgi:hypothetical protein
MAFTFLRCYQPELEHPEDEEDEMPMARSGSVRAFSHLPDRAEGEEPEDGPPQVVVRGSGGMRPYSPMDEVTDESTSPTSRDAEEETPGDDDAPSLPAPQNLAPDTAQAAPTSPRISGLMMRPRPMPLEYARRQARGRMANSTPYSDEQAATEADAPPDTQDLDDPDDQRSFPQDNRPPETAPDTPASSATPQRGVGPTAPSSPQRLQPSRRDIAALQQQVRESNPPAQGGGPAAQQAGNSGKAEQTPQAASSSNSKSPTRDEIIRGILPGDVKVKPNPAAKSDAPSHELSGIGMGAVAHYAEDIAYAARVKGIDPDLIRAIMFMEMSHGWYDPSGLGVPYSLLPGVKSILPMNVNANYWGGAFGSKAELSVGRTNVVSGAEMLRRLQKMSPSAGIAEIATLYNNHKADKVSDYGARVAQIYKDKPWEALTKPAQEKGRSE